MIDAWHIELLGPSDWDGDAAQLVAELSAALAVAVAEVIETLPTGLTLELSQ